MKKFILFVFLLVISNTYSQVSINLVIYNNDGTSTLHDVSAIGEIMFEGEIDGEINDYEMILHYKSGEVLSNRLTAVSNISFEDNNTMWLNLVRTSFQINIVDLDSIIFKENPIEVQPITIKELEVEQVLVQGLTNPWGMALLNHRELLYTQKAGVLTYYNIETQQSIVLSGLPAISSSGQGGLLDVVLHPNFSNNRLVYLTYSKAQGNTQATAIGRGILSTNLNNLENFEELFVALPYVNSGAHFGSRLVFDKDWKMYVSVGDRGNMQNAQAKNMLHGKVMRLNDDGTVPEDNPFVDSSAYRPEIFTLGNRNIQGMAINNVTGEVWAHEHGPQGGDELNIIRAGNNYGWPLVTFGVNYGGGTISTDTARPGIEPPIFYWRPSIAPCGMAFISHGYPTDEYDIVMGALAGQHITRLKIKDGKVVQNIRSLNGYARFRDVRQAPDGKIYALTESPGRLIRLREKE